jgi:sugar/nucleoside kinase (ribokinase family)
MRAAKTSLIPISPLNQAFISVDDNGGNQIIISAGANLDITPEEVQQMCSNIGNAKALVTQLEVDVPSTLAAMEKAKASGAITFFNPSPAPRGASAPQAWSRTGLGVRSIWIFPNCCCCACPIGACRSQVLGAAVGFI